MAEEADDAGHDVRLWFARQRFPSRHRAEANTDSFRRSSLNQAGNFTASADMITNRNEKGNFRLRKAKVQLYQAERQKGYIPTA